MSEVKFKAGDLVSSVRYASNLLPNRPDKEYKRFLMLDFERGRIVAFGDKVEMTGKIPVSGQGVVMAIEGRKLASLLTTFKEESQVSLKDEKGQISLRCGRSRYKLAKFDSSQFPEPPKPEKYARYLVDASALVEGVMGVLNFTAKNDPSRPMLNGVFFETNANTLRMTATNGHVLSSVEVPVLKHDSKNGMESELSQVVQPDILRMVAKMGGENMTIFFAENKIAFSDGMVVLWGAFIGKKYIDYKTMLNRAEQGKKNSQKMAKNQLLEPISRIKTVSGQNHGVLTMEAGEDNALKLSLTSTQSSEQIMEAVEELDSIKYESMPPLKLQLAYLDSSLRSLVADEAETSVAEIGNGNHVMLLNAENSKMGLKQVQVLAPVH